LFAELGTSWLLFDAELLPWNLKAGPLVRDQYATVAAAAAASLPAAAAVLEQASARALPGDGARLDALLDRTRSRSANAAAFTAAYLRYCWPTAELAGVRVAPFQLLASEGAVYHERPHLWHLDVADRLAAACPELIATTRRIAVQTDDPAAVAAATRWWQELTDAGGEGMVVKPAANLTRGDAPNQPAPNQPAPNQPAPNQPAPVQPVPVQPASNQPGSGRSGLVQPGLKVRGREYLRIIYGPDYTEPANLARLRQRAVGHKRSLALREYALGLEALDRVARGEPLWRVHECVFAVLALESEPVDPRL
jgi:protein phosphatase